MTLMEAKARAWRARAMVFGAAAFSLALGGAPALAQQIKLTMADQNPAVAWGPTHALRPWVEQVEKATGGRVKIEIYPAQTLIKGSEMWKGVRSGIADIGWCVQSYWPDQTPLSDVIGLPGLPIKSAEHASGVLWQLYDKYPAIRKEFSEIEPLVLFTTSPTLLISNKKQIKTLDDIKGLKIRAVGGPAIAQLKLLGATPTPMPMPDVYQSLDKGVVDAAAGPWEAVHGFRLFEVAQYYTSSPLPIVYFSVCANKQKWQSLPQDVKAQIMSVSGLAGSRFWGKNFFDSARDAVLTNAKAANRPVNYYELPAAEVERWNAAGTRPVWDDWVKRMEAKGHKEAREILDTTLALLKQ